MDGTLSRRAFLGAASGALAAGMVGCAGGGPGSGDGAETIFRDYTETELDRAYDQGVWADNIGEVFQRIDQKNEEALTRLGEPDRHSYGPTEIEALDWYSPSRGNAPIHVHLYGGAWEEGTSRRSAFLAEPFVDAGAHMVIPDYVKVQDVGGSLLPLADQVRRAVAWVYRNAPSFGADRSRIYLSGHSAGGHLAGVVLVTDWEGEFGLPSDTIREGLCISGMFDLRPVSLSSRNEYVDFDDRTVEALSPIRHLDRLAADVVVAYGTEESPEFQRQSRDFAGAVEGRGREPDADLAVGEGLNHFEILESLGNPYGFAGRIALERMGLGPWV